MQVLASKSRSREDHFRKEMSSHPMPYNVQTDVREKAFSSGRRGTALAVDEVFSCSISENKPLLEEPVMIHNVTPHPSA